MQTMTKAKAINYKLTIPDNKSVYLDFVYNRVLESCKSWDYKSFQENYDNVGYTIYLDMKEIDRMYALEISLEEMSGAVSRALIDSNFVVNEIHIDFV